MASKKKRAAEKALKASLPIQGVISQQAIPQARYDAAGHGPRMRGWIAPASGPNRAAEGQATVRDRARDAVRNEFSGSAGTRVWATNLIGTGIQARFDTGDAALNETLNALWIDWTPVADADGVLDFHGMQTLAVESWITSGEVFLRQRPRRIGDGLTVPLQIQLLESDMVPLFDADYWPGIQNGGRIRQGIELDPLGRRVAYWMYRQHPGDRNTGAVSLADLSRVPADQVRHLFKPLRPGQMRGVSVFAPILAKLRSIGNFDDAVLFRQELGNLFAGVIERPERKCELRSNPDGTTTWYDALTGMPVDPGSDGVPIVALEPGTVSEMAPGEKITFTAPPDSGANYSDFMRWQHMQTSAGIGVPHELLTGDIANVSDRTLRVIINEFRRLCEQIQWQLLIPIFCQPVIVSWIDAAVLVGLITPRQAVAARRVIWSPHAWPYINPVQDANARKIEEDAGFRSRSDIVSTNYGSDPVKVDAERSADAQREKRLGIGPYEPIPDPAPAIRTV